MSRAIVNQMQNGFKLDSLVDAYAIYKHAWIYYSTNEDKVNGEGRDAINISKMNWNEAFLDLLKSEVILGYFCLICFFGTLWSINKFILNKI